MASLQKRGNAFYCQFLYQKRRFTFALGPVSEAEAQAVASKADYILMRIKQGLLDPQGTDIITFIQNDGKVPVVEIAAKVQQSLSFAEFSSGYLTAFGAGAIEANTLATCRIHLKHLGKTLGEKFSMNGLTMADLQRHVDRRQSEVSPVTIKKEIDTLRGAWNWASRMGQVTGNFPSSKLVYHKQSEKLPFMSLSEVNRRIKAGGDAEELRECLYLSSDEMAELLGYVQTAKVPDWIYPMFCTACHTGARRSELLRARAEDVDFTSSVITIREKKRSRGKLTTRRVPLSGFLEEVLRNWLTSRHGRPLLFGKGETEVAVQTAQEMFRKTLDGSKWELIKGYHVFRHSMISACASKGIDQRFIDEWVGHCTEQQRKRYRHLTPSAQKSALRDVFG